MSNPIEVSGLRNLGLDIHSSAEVNANHNPTGNAKKSSATAANTSKQRSSLIGGWMKQVWKPNAPIEKHNNRNKNSTSSATRIQPQEARREPKALTTSITKSTTAPLAPAKGTAQQKMTRQRHSLVDVRQQQHPNATRRRRRASDPALQQQLNGAATAASINANSSHRDFRALYSKYHAPATKNNNIQVPVRPLQDNVSSSGAEADDEDWDDDEDFGSSSSSSDDAKRVGKKLSVPSRKTKKLVSQKVMGSDDDEEESFSSEDSNDHEAILPPRRRVSASPKTSSKKDVKIRAQPIPPQAQTTSRSSSHSATTATTTSSSLGLHASFVGNNLDNNNRQGTQPHAAAPTANLKLQGNAHNNPHGQVTKAHAPTKKKRAPKAPVVMDGHQSLPNLSQTFTPTEPPGRRQSQGEEATTKATSTKKKKRQPTLDGHQSLPNLTTEATLPEASMDNSSVSHVVKVAKAVDKKKKRHSKLATHIEKESETAFSKPVESSLPQQNGDQASNGESKKKRTKRKSKRHGMDDSQGHQSLPDLTQTTKAATTMLDASVPEQYLAQATASKPKERKRRSKLVSTANSSRMDDSAGHHSLPNLPTDKPATGEAKLVQPEKDKATKKKRKSKATAAGDGFNGHNSIPILMETASAKLNEELPPKKNAESKKTRKKSKVHRMDGHSSLPNLAETALDSSHDEKQEPSVTEVKKKTKKKRTSNKHAMDRDTTGHSSLPDLAALKLGDSEAGHGEAVENKTNKKEPKDSEHISRQTVTDATAKEDIPLVEVEAKGEQKVPDERPADPAAVSLSKAPTKHRKSKSLVMRVAPDLSPGPRDTTPNDRRRPKQPPKGDTTRQLEQDSLRMAGRRRNSTQTSAVESNAGKLERADVSTPANQSRDIESDRMGASDGRRKRGGRDRSDSIRTLVTSVGLSSLLRDVIDTRKKLSPNRSRSMDLDSSKRETSAQRLESRFERLVRALLHLTDGTDENLKAGDLPVSLDPGPAFKSVLSVYIPLLSRAWEEDLKAQVERFWHRELNDSRQTISLERIGVILKAILLQLQQHFYIHQAVPREDAPTDRETLLVYATLFEMLRYDAWELSSFGELSKKPSDFKASPFLRSVWHNAHVSELEEKQNPHSFRKSCLQQLFHKHDDKQEPLLYPKAFSLLYEYSNIRSNNMPEAMDENLAKRRRGSRNSIHRAVKEVFKSLPGEALPRQHIVDEVVSLVTSNTHPYIVAVRGDAYTGKSTIAAMVANLPNIKEMFPDGICWLQFFNSRVPHHYVSYRRQLTHLLQQIKGEDIRICQGILKGSNVSEAERGEHERLAMMEAKAKMEANFKDKKVLIILNGVRNEAQLEWFDFFTSQATESSFPSTTIVTTRHHLIPSSDTVVMNTLEEAEAFQLLGGHNSNQIYSSAFSEMTQKCPNLQAISILSRFLSSGSNRAAKLAKAGQILNSLSTDDTMLFELESKCFFTHGSDKLCLIKQACLVAFVIVNNTRRIEQSVDAMELAAVPAGVAESLFSEVIKDVDDDSGIELAKWAMLELISAGILTDPSKSSSETTTLAHPFYREYAEYVVHNDETINSVASNKKKWHRAVASSLLKDEMNWEEQPEKTRDSPLKYIATSLPYQMVAGGMEIEVGDVLASERFLKTRLQCLGVSKATIYHVMDVEQLLNQLVRHPRVESKSYFMPILQKGYQGLIDAINDFPFADADAATCYQLIGLSFSKWYSWEDAVVCFTKALRAPKMTTNKRSEVLYSLGVAYLELENSEAVDCFRESLQLRRSEYGESHYFTMMARNKLAESLLMTSQYPQALEVLEETVSCIKKSDPNGKSVVPPLVSSDAQQCLGKIFYKRQEYDIALNHFEEALGLKEKIFGQESPDKAGLHHLIGVCLLHQGHRGGAIKSLEISLDCWERQDHRSAVRASELLITKGVLQSACGKPEESLQSYRQALDLVQRDFAEKNQKIAHLHYLLGSAHCELGQEADATTQFKASGKLLGLDHVDTAATLCSLASIYEKQGRNPKAMVLLKKALLLEHQFLPNSKAMETTRDRIAKLETLMESSGENNSERDQSEGGGLFNASFHHQTQ